MKFITSRGTRHLTSTVPERTTKISNLGLWPTPSILLSTSVSQRAKGPLSLATSKVRHYSFQHILNLTVIIGIHDAEGVMVLFDLQAHSRERYTL